MTAPPLRDIDLQTAICTTEGTAVESCAKGMLAHSDGIEPHGVTQRASLRCPLPGDPVQPMVLTLPSPIELTRA